MKENILTFKNKYQGCREGKKRKEEKMNRLWTLPASCLFFPESLQCLPYPAVVERQQAGLVLQHASAVLAVVTVFPERE